MPDHHLSERIVVSREVCHGKPRIAGTRIMVYQVLDLLAAGRTIDEVISDDYFPALTKQDVLACITYASDMIQRDTIIPTSL